MKNMRKLLETSKSFELKSLIQYSKDSIVSRTISDSKAGTLTVFAFDKDQGLSEHSAPFDAIVQVLDGAGEFIIGGNPVKAPAGHLVIMPANVPHAVRAVKKFKMLLTMIRSSK
ncbi:MAG TPA: cupin domain-containing protein [Lentisphaeria bacterium]|nr:MAG: cupin [Lentisphaerae bacterium GWF2_50_93]HCE45393.1 cupin domain-containing protein [Lentisphaeria bacterium]